MPDELELAPERIVRVCRAQQEQARLSAVEARLSPETGAGLDTLHPQTAAGDSWLGFSRRTGWLIMISFVVCVVGVANAMLMSVTERFREIATMKCLGALDSFIMIIFVLESALQGLAGGLIGVTLGLALGLVLSWWHLGGLALVNLPVLTILASAGVCLASGALLASLAAVYPAWVAARLAPMEAMRIE
jgi:ABC-type lipoprotein release transport system permease subunit